MKTNKHEAAGRVCLRTGRVTSGVHYLRGTMARGSYFVPKKVATLQICWMGFPSLSVLKIPQVGVLNATIIKLENNVGLCDKDTPAQFCKQSHLSTFCLCKDLIRGGGVFFLLVGKNG